MTNDYNIEFSHLYADEEFGQNQAKGIKKLKEIKSNLKQRNKTFIQGVLIDDYHSINSKIDINSIKKKIKDYGIEIDFLGFEKGLTKIADEFISKIPKEKIKFELFAKSKKEVLMFKGKKDIGLKEKEAFEERHTCVVLSAIWLLSRLGVFKLSEGQLKKFNNKEFIAEEVITILPEKYRYVEGKAIELINTTEYAYLIPKIHKVFT